MTHDMIKAKQLRWVPWRFRVSEADEEAWLATRPPRSDASMLKSLLAHTREEVTVSVPDQPTSLVLPQFQTLLQNSLAMVGAGAPISFEKNPFSVLRVGHHASFGSWPATADSAGGIVGGPAGLASSGYRAERPWMRPQHVSA